MKTREELERILHTLRKAQITQKLSKMYDMTSIIRFTAWNARTRRVILGEMETKTVPDEILQTNHRIIDYANYKDSQK
jgi:hypothetical protein